MATHALDLLYGGLSRTERARLIARCVRTEDFRTLDQVRYTVPQGDGSHFNDLMTIIRRHTNYGRWTADVLRLQAERDEARLLLATAARCHQTLAWLATWGVWKLTGYPVTQAEYGRIVAFDKARPEPLDAFACHLWECYNPEEAAQAGWRPELVAWLSTTEPEDDAAGEAEALAILHAAIKRGELPTSTTTEEGPCLPWGACAAWLMPGQEHEPYGPDWHIPLVEALGGAWAKWEIRPDSEQEAVTARRELLARTLSGVAALHLSKLPGTIHPPASLEAWEAEHERVQAAWPWEDSDWRGLAEHIGANQASNRAQWQAVQAVLEECRVEDFGGEDPIPTDLRAHLDGVEATMGRVDAAYEEAGKVFRADDWPGFSVPEETVVKLLDDTRHVLRAVDGDE